MGYGSSESSDTEVPEVLARAIDQMQADGRRVEVVGSYQNGKLQLDPGAVSELDRKYPDGKFAFVAVNAPFAG
jgi:hypothetical protein